MANLVITQTCRVCLLANEWLKPLSAKENCIDGASFSEMIAACTKYVVHPNDKLPQLICPECVVRLHNAYSFKKLYEASHRTLLALLSARTDAAASDSGGIINIDSWPIPLESQTDEVMIKSENLSELQPELGESVIDLEDTPRSGPPPETQSASKDAPSCDPESEREPQRAGKQNQTPDLDICLICKKPLIDDTVVLRAKGLRTVYESSLKMKDGISAAIEGAIELRLHKKCRKAYTNEKLINAYVRKMKISALPLNKKKVFKYKKTCVLCEEDASDEFVAKESKKPVKFRQLVRQVKATQTKETFQKLASLRNDNWAKRVLYRIQNVDLVEVCARYHKNCYTLFRHLHKQLPTSFIPMIGRPESEYTAEAMSEIFKYLETNREKREFTLESIKEAITLECPKKETVIRKLREKYGTGIAVAHWEDNSISFRFRDS